MFTKYRNQALSFTFLLGICLWAYFYHESQQYVAEIQRLNLVIGEYDNQLTQMKAEKEQTEQKLNNIEHYISKYLLGGKYGKLTKEQFAGILHIQNNTPLDLEAAAAVVYYSDFYGIQYSLILSIIEIESNFNQYLVGTSEDRGYMQIIPETEKYLVQMFGSRIGIEYNPELIFEPDYNLGLGISYIAYLYSRHGDHLDKILTEYNRGAGGLAAYYRENATYSSSYSRAVIDRREKYLQLENQVEFEKEREEETGGSASE